MKINLLTGEACPLVRSQVLYLDVPLVWDQRAIEWPENSLPWMEEDRAIVSAEIRKLFRKIR